jgi:diguanylate cyclase (GGDEF)-like protein
MRQVLEELEEEGGVKEQATAQAQQANTGLQKKHARYTQLQAIAEQLSNMTDRTGIANLAVDRTFSLIGKSDVCLLFLVDRQRQELSLFASKKQDDLASIRAKHGDQFDRYVLRTHRPLLVNDVRRDFRFTAAATMDRPIGSVIACPITIGEAVEGVLRLDSARPQAYTQDDLRFLDIFLDLVNTALANARLFAQTQQLAITDGLTELYRRQPFLEQLAREVARANRSRESLAVLMLDIDHFKRYNDTYGHLEGDRVLAEVAGVLGWQIRGTEIAARYGGEEFAIVLPDTEPAAAPHVAERMRAAVAQVSAFADQVTVSVGVATATEGCLPEQLIAAADRALYAAKEGGRNRVEVAGLT